MKNTIPDKVLGQFVHFYDGRMTLKQYEQWIYATSELEAVLAPEFYYALIDFDYGRKHSHQEACTLLEKRIGLRQIWTTSLKQTLYRVVANQSLEDVADALMGLYDAYGHEHQYFLRKLAHGAALEVSFDHFYRDKHRNWDELNVEEQPGLLGPLLPTAIAQAKEMINWLDSGTIILTGKHDKNGSPSYIDNRPADER